MKDKKLSESEIESQIESDDFEDSLWIDDEDDVFLASDFCPKCGKDYDEIDYEYQICHHCKFNNNKSN